MVGQRTRLAQQPADRWYEGDDARLSSYHERSRRLDTLQLIIQAVISRGWLILGIGGLAPAFIAGANPMMLAVGVGGVLLASRALAKVGATLEGLSAMAIAWEQVAPLFRQAAEAPTEGDAAEAATLRRAPAEEGDAVLAGSRLGFSYPGASRPVFSELDLEIKAGDRVLLEGASGCGKSTLAALLTGLREPTQGLLLCRGLDRHTLGDASWRRRVAHAPQFQQNHVLTGTLAYNLLLGRSWPPREEDLALADEVCRELGLGELLDRMPGGLHQVVGDTGWRLSHGEQSRVFLARALLQDADAVLLDESFGALDPKSAARAARCVLERAQTVVAIAHP
jgi:ATP-binding cassette subfamily B protein